MNREASRSPYRIVWLLATVTSICVGIATYAFYREGETRSEAEPTSRVASETTRPSADSNPQRTGVAGHESTQQAPSGPDRSADGLSEQREAFLRKLAKSASRNEAPTPQAPDEAPSEPAHAGDGNRPATTEELRTRWAAEEPDPVWTEEMSQRTGIMLDEHDIDGSVSDVSCRTTVCKVDFDFADMKEAMELSQETIGQLGPHWNQRAQQGDGFAIRVFVEREQR